MFFCCLQSCVAFRQIFSLVPATPGIQPCPSLRRLGMLRHSSLWDSLFGSSKESLQPAQPQRRAGKLLPAFPCSPGVSLSHGFCEQAVTGKDFHHYTRFLALPKPAVSAPIIIPNHTIYRSVFVYCHRFPAGFELVTDDKCEKSLLKKKQNGTIFNLTASFLSQ